LNIFSYVCGEQLNKNNMERNAKQSAELVESIIRKINLYKSRELKSNYISCQQNKVSLKMVKRLKREIEKDTPKSREIVRDFLETQKKLGIRKLKSLCNQLGESEDNVNRFISSICNENNISEAHIRRVGEFNLKLNP